MSTASVPRPRWRSLIPTLLLTAGLGACGGEDSPLAEAQVSAPDSLDTAAVTLDVSNTDTQEIDDFGPAGPPDGVFANEALTARFFTQATFGPSAQEVARWTNQSASRWLRGEFARPPSLVLPQLRRFLALSGAEDELTLWGSQTNNFPFWTNAISGRDQLRQRMAFALSQILVVSNGGGEVLTDIPDAVGYYMDILNTHAFGNYRELLEAVTYSPAMGHYVTYMGNRKADPQTGRMPDENYAREILQLFTVGLVQLNPDGTAALDAQGQPIELYGNADITGLARVFTGIDIDAEVIDPVDAENTDWAKPMITRAEEHSREEKRFLGTVIPEDTGPKQSVSLALDAIFAHPNVGPFIGRQLIQRFVTSNPQPAYVARVAQAFGAGTFELPDGTSVGTGRRGDLKATIAAVLFDAEAREAANLTKADFGKLREPVLRFTHWARAFNASAVTPEYTLELWEAESSEALNQHPYRARSVFNFYRPGYIAPGTQSGEAGMTVPELQIVNAASVPGYANFMTFFVSGEARYADFRELRDLFEEADVDLDARNARRSFVPDYSRELALAGDPDALVDHLDRQLLYRSMSPTTRRSIVNTVSAIDDEDPEDRVNIAVLLTMTCTDYLIQR
ncbi:MAG: DUF1800 family protein [Pseudomonadota bacterium]